MGETFEYQFIFAINLPITNSSVKFILIEIDKERPLL